MMKYGTALTVVALALVLTASALAQVRMQKAVVASGGTRASNGSMILEGTIGQAVVGHAGNGTMRGSFGFWATSFVAASVPAETGSGAIAAMRITPNPASSSAELRVVLASRGRVEVSLYDAIGRRQMDLYTGEQEVGTLVLPLDVVALASGTYYVAVRATGSLMQLPLTVVR